MIMKRKSRLLNNHMCVLGMLFSMSACSMHSYLTEDRARCQGSPICSHHDKFESSTFDAIEQHFRDASNEQRSEMLVYGFNYLHHKPSYLLDAADALGPDDQRTIARQVLSMAAEGDLREWAMQRLDRDESQ